MKLTAKCFCRSAVSDVLLAQSKVGNLDVSVLVQQQVLKLQVAVNDVVRMQISVRRVSD